MSRVVKIKLIGFRQSIEGNALMIEHTFSLIIDSEVLKALGARHICDDCIDLEVLGEKLKCGVAVLDGVEINNDYIKYAQVLVTKIPEKIRIFLREKNADDWLIMGSELIKYLAL